MLSLDAQGDFIGAGGEVGEDGISFVLQGGSDMGIAGAIGEAAFLEVDLLDLAKGRKAFFIFRQGIAPVGFLKRADGDDFQGEHKFFPLYGDGVVRTKISNERKPC